MNLDSILFLLSVTFQLTGGLMVLLFSLPIRRKTIVKRFMQNSFTMSNEEGVHYDKQCFTNFHYTSYINFAAVICLIVGFMLQLFYEHYAAMGWLGALFVALMTICLIVPIHFICKTIAEKKSSIKMTNEEIEKYDSEPNTEEISEKDIDDLFM